MVRNPYIPLIFPQFLLWIQNLFFRIDDNKNPDTLIEDKIISEAKLAVKEASGLKSELTKKDEIVKILIWIIVILLLIPINYFIIDLFKINSIKSLLVILTQLPLSLLIILKKKIIEWAMWSEMDS